MAFYGSGAGITALVQGDTTGTHTSTSSNRSLSGSWVTHLSRSRTVPSGHTGHFSCNAFFSNMRESEAGGFETRCIITGGASHTSYTFRGAAGHEDHDGGTAMPCWFFTFGPGTYNFNLQVREWQGNVILNNYSGYDHFVVNGYYVRD
jgi:hypothetical protein